MSALANHAFVKMNGLGNEIVVVDMRRAAAADQRRRGARRRVAGRRRALRPDDGALSAAHAGHRRLVRIYNSDGSEAGACGNGMRCVASLCRQGDRQGRADLRDDGRPAATAGRTPSRLVHRRHGRAALRLERDSARRGIPRHPRDRAADRADRQADPAFALGGEHGQSACDLLGRRRRTPTTSPRSGRCWRTIRSFRSAPTSRSAQVKSREHIVIRTWERGAGLTKACGSAACAAAVAAARLKRTGRKVHGDAAGRRPRDRMARDATTTC